MIGRLRAARVIARVQLSELALSPGPYIALGLGMAIAWALCAGFAGAIDSSGFDPRRSPVWNVCTRALSGAFGPVFVERMLTEGPFLAALVAAAAPMLTLLSIGSVFRFGQEKSAGAMELICYGPADGTSWFLGSFLKDAALTAASLLVIVLYCLLLAGMHNLVAGPMFAAAIPVLFLLAVSISSLGILCSVLAANAAAALALFLGLLVLFAASLTGSIGAGTPAVRTVSQAVSAILQWFSPFHYAALAARGYSGGRAGEYGGALALLIALTAGALTVSHAVLWRRGVRP